MTKECIELSDDEYEQVWIDITLVKENIITQKKCHEQVK